MSTLVLALVAGAVVGLALGALGGGGSVLTVPALIYLLGFTPAAAATASLIIVTVTSTTALHTHATSGDVRWKSGALFAVAGIAPAAAAATLSSRVPAPVLTAAFASVAALAALALFRTPSQDRESEAVRPARAAGAGAGLGAVTGFLGVGGGFLAVPALVTALGLRMRPAVGTSLLVITVNSLAALAARAGTHAPLHWAVIAPFTGAAILAARDGRRLAAKVSSRSLQRTFAVVLLAVAAFMLTDALH
ncbi:sulfite exporter TauE/SafE family protein [Streptomyces sp. JL4002]|uniref:sulfite exporter TauE/SafE family protein n=1 Tax=Streptomyces sp. JL4002 TaxID=3404781 RepID=UPI003B281FDC